MITIEIEDYNGNTLCSFKAEEHFIPVLTDGCDIADHDEVDGQETIRLQLTKEIT